MVTTVCEGPEMSGQEVMSGLGRGKIQKNFWQGRTQTVTSPNNLHTHIHTQGKFSITVQRVELKKGVLLTGKTS